MADNLTDTLARSPDASTPPEGATAVLVLGNGETVWGRGIGATGTTIGEVCFNTSITGYQEILTDPSYAGQIITFTFPHAGNVGANPEDIETTTPAARGLILRSDITHPSSWRAAQHLDAWLKTNNLIGLAGVDTRRLTRLIRDSGAPTGVIHHAPDGVFNLDKLKADASAWPGLEGAHTADRKPNEGLQSLVGILLFASKVQHSIAWEHASSFQERRYSRHASSE